MQGWCAIKDYKAPFLILCGSSFSHLHSDLDKRKSCLVRLAQVRCSYFFQESAQIVFGLSSNHFDECKTISSHFSHPSHSDTLDLTASKFQPPQHSDSF